MTTKAGNKTRHQEPQSAAQMKLRLLWNLTNKVSRAAEEHQSRFTYRDKSPGKLGAEQKRGKDPRHRGPPHQRGRALTPSNRGRCLFREQTQPPYRHNLPTDGSFDQFDGFIMERCCSWRCSDLLLTNTVNKI